MAVVGGFILIIIMAFLAWVVLMVKFEKIGNKVTGRIDKTFKTNRRE